MQISNVNTMLQSRGQTTIQNCIGCHVNILSDYKSLIDMLTKFCQNHIPPALLKRPYVQCPSMFTKISMYSCAHVAQSRNIPIYPSAC